MWPFTKKPVITDSSPRGLALARCNELIEWYDKAKRLQRLAYQSFQVAAILLSGLTPILILWSKEPNAWTALPAALAAIATGLLGIFQWKENYIRFAYVSEALQSEKIKFQTRTTTNYDDKLEEHEALANFVTHVEDLVMSEVADWRGQMRRAATKDSNSTQITSGQSQSPSATKIDAVVRIQQQPPYQQHVV